jgi:Ni/Co efflux regulator RcnB
MKKIIPVLPVSRKVLEELQKARVGLVQERVWVKDSSGRKGHYRMQWVQPGNGKADATTGQMDLFGNTEKQDKKKHEGQLQVDKLNARLEKHGLPKVSLSDYREHQEHVKNHSQAVNEKNMKAADESFRKMSKTPWAVSEVAASAMERSKASDREKTLDIHKNKIDRSRVGKPAPAKDDGNMKTGKDETGKNPWEMGLEEFWKKCDNDDDFIFQKLTPEVERRAVERFIELNPGYKDVKTLKDAAKEEMFNSGGNEGVIGATWEAWQEVKNGNLKKPSEKKKPLTIAQIRAIEDPEERAKASRELAEYEADRVLEGAPGESEEEKRAEIEQEMAGGKKKTTSSENVPRTIDEAKTMMSDIKIGKNGSSLSFSYKGENYKMTKYGVIALATQRDGKTWYSYGGKLNNELSYSLTQDLVKHFTESTKYDEKRDELARTYKTPENKKADSDFSAGKVYRHKDGWEGEYIGHEDRDVATNGKHKIANVPGFKITKPASDKNHFSNFTKEAWGEHKPEDFEEVSKNSKETQEKSKGDEERYQDAVKRIRGYEKRMESIDRQLKGEFSKDSHGDYEKIGHDKYKVKELNEEYQKLKEERGRAVLEIPFHMMTRFINEPSEGMENGKGSWTSLSLPNSAPAGKPKTIEHLLAHIRDFSSGSLAQFANSANYKDIDKFRNDAAQWAYENNKVDSPFKIFDEFARSKGLRKSAIDFFRDGLAKAFGTR